MVTRRRRLKKSHNKTRTTSKVLLRKTTYKNKKNKNRKTKKRYQSGGGPKARAKGAKGVPAEFKLTRHYIKRGMVHPNTLQKQVMYQKANPTAEFDLDSSVTGLPHHISVKSVKQKTPGQNSFTIMCGKSNRFINQVGNGKVPYHMVVVIREKHPTIPNKTQYHALEIDLRSPSGRKLLFGSAEGCKIKEIVEKAERLSNAYCKNDEDAETIREIVIFNEYLRSLNAKIQLAPKKGNTEKKRDTRAQASIGPFRLDSPTSRGAVISEHMLSSEANTPDDNMGNSAEPAAPLNLTATSVSRAPGSRNTGSRNTGSRNTSSRNTGSRNTGSRNTGSSRGVNKPPVPQVSYFRSFKPRYRELSTIPAPLTTPALSNIPELSTIPEL